MRTVWSIDEDEALLNLSNDASFNWSLICELLASLYLGPGETREPWDCYNRYKILLQQKAEKTAVAGMASSVGGSGIASQQQHHHNTESGSGGGSFSGNKVSKFKTKLATRKDSYTRLTRLLSVFELIKNWTRQRPERMNPKSKIFLLSVLF